MSMGAVFALLLLLHGGAAEAVENVLTDPHAASGEWCCAAVLQRGFGVASRTTTGLWPKECSWMEMLFDAEVGVAPHFSPRHFAVKPPLDDSRYGLLAGNQSNTPRERQAYAKGQASDPGRDAQVLTQALPGLCDAWMALKQPP